VFCRHICWQNMIIESVINFYHYILWIKLHDYNIRGSFDKFGKFPWNALQSIWWRDINSSRKIHSLNPFRPNFSQKDAYLAPCDFFLFPNLKTWLGGKKFSSNEEVIVAINEYFADFETAYFKWLPNMNYVSFLVEIWPEGIWRVDLSRSVASSNGL